VPQVSPPSARGVLARQSTKRSASLGRAVAIAAEGGVTASADVAKFSDYAFVTDKAPVFESYGYTAEDSQELADLYERQAAEKYASGDYTQGKLDQYGQRITIQIDLPGQGAAAGRSTILNTGWIVEPGGSIRLITPFAGFGQ
jgi:filamentous hemagglutinin